MRHKNNNVELGYKCLVLNYIFEESLAGKILGLGS
jgi:hypothetical protein